MAGRPKQETVRKAISLRLSGEALEQIKAICYQSGENRTQVIERLINQEYKAVKK